MQVWSRALSDASRATSEALWQWRKRDHRALSQDNVVRAWDHLMPQSGKSLSSSTLLRYESTRYERARHAELQTLITLAALYGHSFADLATHIDHAIAPWTQRLARILTTQPTFSAIFSPVSREQAMLDAFRRLPEGRQEELVTFAQMLAGGTTAQAEPQHALVEALGEVDGWSRRQTPPTRRTASR